VPDDELEIDHQLLLKLAHPSWEAVAGVLAASGLFLPASSGRGPHAPARTLDALLRTTSACRELRAVAGLDSARVASVPCRTLAVYGEYSHCLSSMAGLRENIDDCEARLLPGVGHFFPVVQPELFATEIEQFARSRR
jgi:pimeloyl-ACP methyl ester carboxylesterase